MTHVLCERKSGNIANPNYVCFCVVLRDLGFFCDLVLKVFKGLTISRKVKTQEGKSKKKKTHNRLDKMVEVNVIVITSAKRHSSAPVFGFLAFNLAVSF